jgi:SAM-dependent methyltransferase
MQAFYQHDYKQAGLTTDLPDANALENLLTTGFKGSNKDFSRVLALFSAIGVPSGARILDFGANWGYGVWQFRKAGYEATGYELSKPRAEFAGGLGVQVVTDWRDVIASGPFDVAFSSHVLEHTPDPAQAIRDQIAVLKPDGYLIALFPNGSDAFRVAEPQAFHRLWGRVHPVMLNDNFVSGSLESQILFQGSLCDEDLDKLRRWDRRKHEHGNVGSSELLVLAQAQGDRKRSIKRSQGWR